MFDLYMGGCQAAIRKLELMYPLTGPAPLKALKERNLDQKRNIEKPFHVVLQSHIRKSIVYVNIKFLIYLYKQDFHDIIIVAFVNFT